MVSPLRQAARRLPKPVKVFMGRALANWSEWQDYRRCLREGVVPPTRMWTMVGADNGFVEGGRVFFEFLVKHGRLTRRSTVLDVGCGLGKTAIHFATYLRSPGFYRGFDVELESINWARRAITRRFPLIRFEHVSLASEMYNAGAVRPASDFRFPYADTTFDLVYLASVFTHMFDAEVANYLAEIGRVLKPGGRCVATFYLMNEEKRRGIEANTSAFTFAIPFKGAMIERRDPPEGAVAHEEARVMEMISMAGLSVVDLPRYGIWAVQNIQDQDFLILEKS